MSVNLSAYSVWDGAHLVCAIARELTLLSGTLCLGLLTGSKTADSFHISYFWDFFPSIVKSNLFQGHLNFHHIGLENSTVSHYGYPFLLLEITGIKWQFRASSNSTNIPLDRATQVWGRALELQCSHKLHQMIWLFVYTSVWAHSAHADCARLSY